MDSGSRPSASPKAQILGLADLAPSAAKEAPRLLSQPNPLHQVKTTLTVRLGEIELTIGELLGAKENQVLRLNRTIDQPVDILLEGQVVARGTLVAVDDCFGVSITELPLPLRS